MTEQFFSEYGCDAWIASNLPLPDHGTYADIGAAQPTHCSNTAFLRARGWRGICVDGNPCYRDQWGPRQLITAVVSRQPYAHFSAEEIPGHSGIREYGTLVPCRTLESLLLENGIEKLDFLSLDLEGGEFEALLSMNIARHDPTIIISEYATHGIGNDFRVRDYLLDLGYAEVHRTIANIIYHKP